MLILGGCAHTPRGGPSGPEPIRVRGRAFVDLARVSSLRAYGLLMEGRIDSGLTVFQQSLARAAAERTPSEGAAWGLALAYRLRGFEAYSDTLALALLPPSQPESFLARAWFAEARRDTLGALAGYRDAILADSTYSPPCLRAAQLQAARGEWRVAEALVNQAAALGDTLAPAWKSRLVPPPPPTSDDSLAAAAESSTALTRLQWAALLRRHGQVRWTVRWPEPELVHFHPARDSLHDLAGTPWVSLVSEAVKVSHVPLFPDGTYHGEDVVSRAQFALWLDQFAPASPEGAGAPAADLFPTDYRAAAVERALARRLMNCTGPARFEPERAMTGAEVLEALAGLGQGR